MLSLSNLTRTSVAVAILGLGALSCGSPEREMTTTSSSNAPSWIERPNGAFDEGNGVVIYGVGISASNANPAMMRENAKVRASRELAQALGTLVQGMTVSYMDSSQDFVDPDTATSTEFVQDVTRSVSQEFLVGPKVADSYKDPLTGTYYILMRLDLDDVMASYKNKMSAAADRERTRNRIKGNAEDFLKQLDDQLDKINNMDASEVEEEFMGGGG